MLIFCSTVPVEDLAKALAAIMWDPPYTVPRGYPCLEEQGGWWELSNCNDHKLDVFEQTLEGRMYRFRDRYAVPARRQRVIKVLDELGASIKGESPLEPLARSQKETP